MKSIMTPKERIELQVLIYRDLIKDNQKDEEYYQSMMGTAEWAALSFAEARARRVTYEMVADKLQEILDDWTEEDDDGK